MDHIEEELADRIYCKDHIVKRIFFETNNNPLRTCVSKLILALQILSSKIKNFFYCQSDRFAYFENRKINYHSFSGIIFYEKLKQFLAAIIAGVSIGSGFNPGMVIYRNRINAEWQK